MITTINQRKFPTYCTVLALPGASESSGQSAGPSQNFAPRLNACGVDVGRRTGWPVFKVSSRIAELILGDKRIRKEREKGGETEQRYIPYVCTVCVQIERPLSSFVVRGFPFGICRGDLLAEYI